MNKNIYPVINCGIEFITEYKAGISFLDSLKNIKTYKMSSNENPLGTSLMTLRYIKEGCNKLERYPSTNQLQLKKKISNIHNLNYKNIVLGNGSDEFFNLICTMFLSPGDESIICEHSFLLYKTQILVSGAIPVIIKEKSGKIDIIAILKSINNRSKLIFITNPNNPTGTFLTLRELNILKDLVPKHIVLLIDSAYAEYVIDDRYNDGKKLLDGKNIFMTRTLSKIYGLASLRIGWMYGNFEYINIIKNIKSPFNINKLAQIAGQYAIIDKNFCKMSILFNIFWITKVTNLFKKKNIILNYSVGNFVTMKICKKVPIELIENFINNNGLLVRNVFDYRLFNSIRVSLGISKANIKFCKLINNICGIEFILDTFKINLNKK